MYTTILKESRLYYLQHGILSSDLHFNFTHHRNYKHGFVYDLLIQPNSRIQDEIRVPSVSLINVLETWGISNFVSDTIRVMNNEGRLNIHTNMMQLRYKCNTREIFKPLNNLIKSLEATKKMNKMQSFNPKYKLTDTVLLSTLKLPNLTNQISALTLYDTFSVIDRLKNNQFRHYYKILHPNTGFYQ